MDMPAMLRMRYVVSRLCSAGALILSGPFVGGCETNPAEQSPTPVPGSLELYEDLRWDGWLDYADESLEIHVPTYFDLFAYRDGLFCGRYMAYWGFSGAYLAVNPGTGWVVFIDVPEGTYEGWGTMGRTYGTVSPTYDLTGWLDGTLQGEYDAIDPMVTPDMTSGEEFLRAQLLSDASLALDIQPLTLGELLAYATKEGESTTTTTSGTTSTVPMSLPIDLPMYFLELIGPASDGAAEADAHLCTWCNEPGDSDTPSPLQPGTGPDGRGGRR